MREIQIRISINEHKTDSVYLYLDVLFGDSELIEEQSPVEVRKLVLAKLAEAISSLEDTL